MTISSKDSKEVILKKIDKLSFIGGLGAVLISVLSSVVGVFIVWGALALFNVSLSPVAYLLGVIAFSLVFIYRSGYKLIKTHITSEITGAILREVQKGKAMEHFINVLREGQDEDEHEGDN